MTSPTQLPVPVTEGTRLTREVWLLVYLRGTSSKPGVGGGGQSSLSPCQGAAQARVTMPDPMWTEELSCSLQPRTYTEEELNAKLTRRVQRAARRQAKQEELKRLHRAQVKP